MKKISVIVPVFNTEKFLYKCVNSLINQTIKSEYEIILVDDGSTDNSCNICDDFAADFHNIVTYHKKNGGLSSARNYGLNQAKGEYVCFVDSDDYVSDDFLETMYSNMIEHKAQIAMCNYCEVYNDGRKISKKAKDVVCDSKTAIKDACYQKNFDTNMTMKMIKKSFFDDIKFREGIWYEDTDIFYRIYDKADVICFTNKVCYFYYQNENGIMHTEFNVKVLEIVDVAERMYEFIKQNYITIIDAGAYRYVYSCLYVVHKILQSNYDLTNTEIFINVREKIKPKCNQVYKDNNVRVIKKIEIFLYNTNLSWYIFFYKLLRKIKGK